MLNKKSTKTRAWREFERGKEYLNSLNVIAEIDEAYRFFEGDQWKGLKTGGERQPTCDFIRGIVNYKVAVVTQNDMEIVYLPANYDDPNMQMAAREVCDKLNRHAAQVWESENMDDLMHDVIEDAVVARAKYLYFYYDKGADKAVDGVIRDTGRIAHDELDVTNVMFGDEQEKDVQRQPYILIPMRRRVSDVRKEAEANGMPKDQLMEIQPDTDTDLEVGDKSNIELKTDNEDGDGKCLCILRLWKENGEVHISKSTRMVEYVKPMSLGLKLYPIAAFVWSRVKGTCRGQGEVNRLIPNQINANRLMAYRYLNAKMTAWPKPIVNTQAVPNGKDAFLTVGTAIEVDGVGLQDVRNAVGYLQPAQASPDAKAVQDELVDGTQKNAGAADVAQGKTEMDTYSAVLAIQEAAAAPLNRQTVRYKRFIEDIARIWFDMWSNYYVDGLPILREEQLQGETGQIEKMQVEDRIPHELLQQLRLEVKVEVTPASPYNKLTEQQKLDNLLQSGLIDFEEYVTALPESEPSKERLSEIVRLRGIMEKLAAQMEQLQGENEQLTQKVGMAEETLQRAMELNNENKEKSYTQGQIDAIKKMNRGGNVSGL